MDVFKSKAAKIAGTAVLIGGSIAALTKGLDYCWDKVVIQDWCAKSVKTWLDSQYEIPELKYRE